ncbi:DUF4157 domain-containing protein [Phormidium tenue FACHB-886]|nr:DUF4157 domain-containing protein [Phormidium tenue FACHB-886]
MAGLHVDVGKQLSKLGFGPASFKAIGSPPSPQPLQLPGTTVQRSSDQAKETGTQVGEGIESRLDQSRGGGSPLSSEVLAFMEPRFGADFTQVRVHTDSAAVQLSQELGAHAFAIGNDIYFGAGKSPANDNLTAHELTHVIQQNGANLQPSRPANEDQQQTEHLSNTVTATDTNSEPDAQIIDISQVPQSKNQVSLRPATEADRLFWSNIDSHPLFKKLINNYMDGKGEKLILTQQEMLDLKPEVDFRGSKTFTHAIDTLSEETSEQKIIRGSALAQAHLPLTLGFFTVDYEGVLTSIIYTIPYGTKQKAGWQFNGLARFRDTWDFDPKPFATSHRGFVGELQTRIGNVLLPGASFEIESQAIPVSEGMEDGLGGDAIATFKPDATSKPNPSQVTPAPAPGVSPPSPPPPTAIQPKLAATGF